MDRFHNNCLLVVTALMSLIISALPAQEEYTVRYYTSEYQKSFPGLSQNWVYSVLQDRQGLIWIGTWDGLNRFDGYSFKSYSISDGLPDHTINDIIEDSGGRLWLATQNGLSCFDPETATFRNFTHFPVDTTSLFAGRINVIEKDTGNTLWLGTGAGLVRFSIDNFSSMGFFTAPQDYTSPKSNYILDILADDSLLWIGTTFGLVIFNKISGKSTRYYHRPGDPNSLPGNNIRSLLHDNNGNYWIGTSSGIAVCRNPGGPYRIYDKPDFGAKEEKRFFVRDIYQDRQGAFGQVRTTTDCSCMTRYRMISGRSGGAVISWA